MASTNRPLAAAVVVSGAMAVVALVDSFFFHIAEVLGLWQFHLLRALSALPILWVWSRLGGIRILPYRVWPVLLRGFAMSGAMILYFGSLGFLSVPVAAAGLFTSPIWILVLTAVFLRQRIGPRRIGAVMLGFGGAIIVLDPRGAALSPVILMPLAAGFFWGLGAIATRAWCDGETALSLLASFFVCMIFWGTSGIAILTWFDIQAPVGVEGLLFRAWGDFTPVAAFWFVAQVLTAAIALYGIVRGYQLAEASYVGVFEYSFLVFAALWGALFLGGWPTQWELLGLGMILSSGLLIALSPAARAAAA